MLINRQSPILNPLLRVRSCNWLKSVLAVLILESDCLLVCDILIECVRVDTRKVALWKLLYVDVLLIVRSSDTRYRIKFN